MHRMLVLVVAVLAAIALEGEAVGATRSNPRPAANAPVGTSGVAPGAPGATGDWASADKHGR
jgi:hypothetical protein